MKLFCKVFGHKWFLGRGSFSEFVPVPDRCLRCSKKRVVLPWGDCLGEHPLAEHYDEEGRLVLVDGCPHPR